MISCRPAKSRFPCVLFQGFEAYVGMLLLKTAVVGIVAEWQVKNVFYYYLGAWTCIFTIYTSVAHELVIKILIPF